MTKGTTSLGGETLIKGLETTVFKKKSNWSLMRKACYAKTRLLYPKSGWFWVLSKIHQKYYKRLRRFMKGRQFTKKGKRFRLSDFKSFHEY